MKMALVIRNAMSLLMLSVSFFLLLRNTKSATSKFSEIFCFSNPNI